AATTTQAQGKASSTKDIPKQGDTGLDNGGKLLPGMSRESLPNSALRIPYLARAPPTVQIIVAPSEEEQRDALAALAQEIAQGLGQSLPFGVVIELGAAAQFDEIMSHLGGYRKNGQYVLPYNLETGCHQDDPTIILTDADLTGEGKEGSLKDYIFGRTYPSANLTITSIHRFNHSEAAVFVARNVKNIIHEAGHLFGLGTSRAQLSNGAHCADLSCAMCFSPTVRELDAVQAEFCVSCNSALARLFPAYSLRNPLDNGGRANSERDNEIVNNLKSAELEEAYSHFSSLILSSDLDTDTSKWIASLLARLAEDNTRRLVDLLLYIRKEHDSSLRVWPLIVDGLKDAIIAEPIPTQKIVTNIISAFEKIEQAEAEGILEIEDVREVNGKPELVGYKRADKFAFEQAIMHYFEESFTKGIIASKEKELVYTEANKPPLMLIGVCGQRRAGKGTLAKMLIEEAGFKKYDLFTKTKQIALDVYENLTYAEAETDKTPASRVIFGRLFELFENIDPDRYIDYALEYIREYQPSLSETPVFTNRWVISDIRIEREVDAARAMGASIWRIEMPASLRNQIEPDSKADEHKTETGVLEIPEEKIDRAIVNNGTFEEYIAKIDSVINVCGLKERALAAFYRIDFGGFDEYLGYLKEIKLTSARRAQEYDRRIPEQVEDIALQYAGENNMIERTPEEMNNKANRARKILEGIYADPRTREDFLYFLLTHQIQDTWRNRISPLAVVAGNWISDRPLTDAGLVAENADLFDSNQTIAGHPWYGRNVMPLHLEHLVLPRPSSKILRVLIPGSAESLNPQSSTVLYLREILKRAYPGLDIRIVANDIVFPEFVHIFDVDGKFTGCEEHRLIFNEREEFVDSENNVVLVKVDLSDPLQDLCGSQFIAQDKFDLVICSRLAIQYENNPEKLRQLRDNLIELLDKEGLLLYDTEDARHAEIIYKDADLKTHVVAGALPYQDIDSYGRSTDKIIQGFVAPINQADENLIKTAYAIAEIYATPESTIYEKLIISRVLAAAGETAVEIAAVILKDVPNDVVENELEKFGPEVMNDIFKVRRGLIRGSSIVAFPADYRLYVRGLYRAKLEAAVQLPEGLKETPVLNYGAYKIAIAKANEKGRFYVVLEKSSGSDEIERHILVVDGFKEFDPEHLARLQEINNVIAQDRRDNAGTGTISFLFSKGDQKGGLNPVVRPNMLGKLVHDFMVILGEVRYLGAAGAIEKWGDRGFAYSFAEMHKNPKFTSAFVVRGQDMVTRRKIAEFVTWLDEAKIIDAKDAGYNELVMAMGYLSGNGQQIMLIRKTSREEIMRKYILGEDGQELSKEEREEIARDLLKGIDPYEADEQEFVKRVVVGNMNSSQAHRGSLRKEFVAAEYSDGGVLAGYFRDMQENLGLESGTITSIANGVHSPSSSEIDMEMSKATDADLDTFIRNAKAKVSLLLIDSGSPRAEINEALGIEVLAGALKDRYQGKGSVSVEICDLQLEENIDELLFRIKIQKPDVVGISIKIGTYASIKPFIEALFAIPEAERPIVVLGNTVSTFANEKLIAEFPGAILCLGEGEGAICGITDLLLELKGEANRRFTQEEFNSQLYARNIPNLMLRLDGVNMPTKRVLADLTHYKSPERRTVREILKRGGIVTAEASRGCPWGHCTFCVVNERFKGWRPRPEMEVIAELEYLVSEGVNSVYFVDEDFIGSDIERARRIAEEITSRGLNHKLQFLFSTRVRAVYEASCSDEENAAKIELFRAMKKAGLSTVFLGIESGSATQLKRYGKGATVEENERAIAILKELDIDCEPGFIMFDQLMTMAELQENLEFLERTGLKYTTSRIVGEMRPQEGSAYKTMLLRAGLLDVESLSLNSLTYEARYQDPRIKTVLDTYKTWESKERPVIDYLQGRVRGNVTEQEREIAENYLIRLRLLDLELVKALVANAGEVDSIIDRFSEQREFLVAQAVMALRQIQQDNISQIAEATKKVIGALPLFSTEEVLSRVMPETRVIIVAGATASGKTTDAENIDQLLNASGRRSVVLSLDRYYMNEDECDILSDGRLDYEKPQAMHLERIKSDIRRLLAGEEVET
ncbi:MAG: radical SAM protein, partial [Candidatus Omnitrophota bacterium]